MNNLLYNQIIKSFFWLISSRLCSQIIQFVVSVIIARLLLPGDYGCIAILMVFIGLCETFTDFGFKNALIQRKKLNEIDCSSVFWLNLTIGAILFLILFFTAPLIGIFFNIDNFVRYLRVLLVIPIIDSFSMVHNALLSRRLLFKKAFICRIIALMTSASISIFVAYKGWGIWTLVIQRIINSLMMTICLWIIIHWIPKLLINFKSIKEMFSYGYKLLIASLINSLYNDFFTLIVGKVFSQNDLGLYNRGQSYPKILYDSLYGSLAGVMFPAFSKIQNDHNKMLQIQRKAIRSILFILLPGLAMLFLFSKNIIIFLLTEKWLGATYYMKVCCFMYATFPISLINLQMIRSIGRSDVALYYEIITKLLLVAFVIAFLNSGIKFLVCAVAFHSYISTTISLLFVKKLFSCRILDIIFDQKYSLFSTILCGVFISILKNNLSSKIQFDLILYPILFVITYILINFLFQRSPLHDYILYFRNKSDI